MEELHCADTPTHSHTSSPGPSGSSSILKYWVPASANLQKKRSFMCILVPLSLVLSSLNPSTQSIPCSFFSQLGHTDSPLSPNLFSMPVRVHLLFPIIVLYSSLVSIPYFFFQHQLTIFGTILSLLHLRVLNDPVKQALDQLQMGSVHLLVVLALSRK